MTRCFFVEFCCELRNIEMDFLYIKNYFKNIKFSESQQKYDKNFKYFSNKILRNCILLIKFPGILTLQ